MKGPALMKTGCVWPLLFVLTACASQPPASPPASAAPPALPAARNPPVADSRPQIALPAGAAAEVPNAGMPVVDTRQTYDLPALVDLALQANPETRISWQQAQAASARLQRSRSAWYPTLTAMAFGGYYKTSFPVTGAALLSSGVSSVASLDLAWTLFDFGRRQAQVDAGAQRLDAANFAFTRKHQEIAYRVASGFFNYQAALAKVLAAQQTFESAKANAGMVQAKLGKGLATRPDLLLAIQEQARAGYDLQDARGGAIQSKSDLNTSLGVSPGSELQFVDLNALPLPAELIPAVEKIADQALADRPDLLGRLAELRAREAEVQKARAEFWPKISLSGRLGNQYWGNIHTSPPSPENYSTSLLIGTAMLNVEWTLFDGFERTYAVHEAEARQEASRAETDALRLEIMREIWKAYADTKTALEKRDFASALLQAAEASFAATQESYSHGLSTVIELLSVQKDLARARYTEIDSRAGLLRAAAQLVYVAGGGGREDGGDVRLPGGEALFR